MAATNLIELTLTADGSKVQVCPLNIARIKPHGTGSVITYSSIGNADLRAETEIVNESPSAIRTAANS